MGNLDEKVATAFPTDGKSTDATTFEDVIEDKAMASEREVPTTSEPAPEPKTICEATASANEVADTAVDAPAKIANVTDTEAEEARGISVGGGCCGIGGGAHAGCHGCGLNICGLGGNIHVRDTVDEDEIIVKDDAEARGISVGGGCCGIGGGADVGCHGCGLNICGLGGNIHVRDAVDENVI